MRDVVVLVLVVVVVFVLVLVSVVVLVLVGVGVVDGFDGIGGDGEEDGVAGGEVGSELEVSQGDGAWGVVEDGGFDEDGIREVWSDKEFLSEGCDTAIDLTDELACDAHGDACVSVVEGVADELDDDFAGGDGGEVEAEEVAGDVIGDSSEGFWCADGNEGVLRAAGEKSEGEAARDQ